LRLGRFLKSVLVTASFVLHTFLLPYGLGHGFMQTEFPLPWPFCFSLLSTSCFPFVMSRVPLRLDNPLSDNPDFWCSGALFLPLQTLCIGPLLRPFSGRFLPGVFPSSPSKRKITPSVVLVPNCGLFFSTSSSRTCLRSFPYSPGIDFPTPPNPPPPLQSCTCMKVVFADGRLTEGTFYGRMRSEEILVSHPSP